MNSFAAPPIIIDINEGIEEVPFEVGDVDKEVTSSFVQTIYASDIQKTQTNLNSVIEKFSGISIRQSGGLGSYAQISIRGKSSDQIKVYIDGILLNDASGSGVDLSLIPINEISSIEIYKDVAPIEFAEVSNGGVINIKTIRHSKSQRLSISQMVGSFNTFQTNINTQLNTRNWQTLFSAGVLQSENNYPYINENGTFNNKSDDRIERRQNNQLDQYNVIVKAKKRISSDENITYQFEVFNRLKGLPPINNNSIADTHLENKKQHFNIKYTNKNRLIKNTVLNINLAANNKNTMYDNRNKSFGLTAVLLQFKTKSIKSQAYVKTIKNNHEFIGNSEVRFEQLDYDDLLLNTSTRTNNRTSFILGIQSNSYFKNRKWIISPTIRFQYTKDQLDGISNTISKTDTNSLYQTFSPQLGLRFSPNLETSVKFNIGKFYRVPNYIELFGGRGYIGANEDLLPENGINADIGFEKMFYPKSNIITLMNWQNSIFHSRINNEIITTFNSRGEGKPRNTGRSIISGIENQVLLELFYNVEFSSNATFLLAYNYTDSNRKRSLPGRPKISFSNKVTFHHRSMEIYLENLQEKYMFYDDEELLPAKDRNISNFGYTFSNKKISFSIALNNVQDNRYKAFFFQTSPGRSIQFSMTFKTS